MGLKERLRKLRQENNKTLQEVSEDIDLTTGYLSSLERGNKKNPTADVLDKLSNYYNVSMDYLMGKTDQKIPYDYKWYQNENSKELKQMMNLQTSEMILLHEKQLINFIHEEFGKNIPTISKVKKKLKHSNLFNEENYSNNELKKLINYTYDLNDTNIKDKNYIYHKATDNSMKGSKIFKGDKVKINKHGIVEDGDIAAVYVFEKGKIYIRTLRKILVENKEKYILQPQNENYDIMLLEKKDLDIIGKIIEIRRLL